MNATGKLLQISQLGNPILRQRAQPVPDVQAPWVQSLIDDMLLTVADANGVGIAAPQVYQPWRIMIVWSRPNPRYPHAPSTEPQVIVNPEIVEASDRVVKDWEGCLSIPGLRGLVPRHQEVHARWVDRDGAQIEQRYTDFVARVFQHEFDHLEGTMFLDRVETPHELMMEKEWLKLMAKTQ